MTPTCFTVARPHDALLPAGAVEPGKTVPRRRPGVKFHAYLLRHAMKRRVTREYGLDAARRLFWGQKSILTTDKYAADSDEELAAKVARKLG